MENDLCRIELEDRVENFLGNLGRPDGNFWLGPETKMDVLERQIKIVTVGLKEHNPEIMSDLLTQECGHI